MVQKETFLLGNIKRRNVTSFMWESMLMVQRRSNALTKVARSAMMSSKFVLADPETTHFLVAKMKMMSFAPAKNVVATKQDQLHAQNHHYDG
jgi:hypothetical protein